jgi:hypothetical protein
MDVRIGAVVEISDPAYFTQPWIVNCHFKKLGDGAKWNPAPCSVRSFRHIEA